MKLIKYLFISGIIVLSIYSCHEPVPRICHKPPEPLIFQLLDYDSFEDAIYVGTCNKDLIRIVPQSTNIDEVLEIDSSVAGNYYFIANDIGYNVGEENKNYKLFYNEEEYFEFIYQSTLIRHGICSLYESEGVGLRNAPYNIEDDPFRYILVVDTIS